MIMFRHLSLLHQMIGMAQLVEDTSRKCPLSRPNHETPLFLQLLQTMLSILASQISHLQLLDQDLRKISRPRLSRTNHSFQVNDRHLRRRTITIRLLLPRPPLLPNTFTTLHQPIPKLPKLNIFTKRISNPYINLRRRLYNILLRQLLRPHLLFNRSKQINN